MKYSTPLPPSLVDELFQFWDRIFPGEHDILPHTFLGSEDEHNQFAIYVERQNGEIVATCNAIYAQANPRLGGLGEVATEPTYQGQGLATKLCHRALTDFRDRGVEAIFLGTNNWRAARIYHRLGWRKLAGSNVMLNIINGHSPEMFLVDYFRSPGKATVKTSGAFLRLPIIPLLHTPHDWQILDANTAMASTRYEVQGSCNGLYRRYGYIGRSGFGEWFAAMTDDGRVVGLSTARLNEAKQCYVDGFTHPMFADCYKSLIDAAIQWGKSSAATSIYSRLSDEDEEKQQLWQSFDFQKIAADNQIELGDRHVKMIQYEYTET